MRPCSICTHNQAEDINQELINGVPVRKIAEKYGISHMAVQRHKAKHIVTVSTVTELKPDPNVTSSNVTEYQGNHWKVRKEGEEVILYFKNRVIPLTAIGGHFQDPKSKEKFKREGDKWFLGIPYFGWVNLDNIFCFYE